MKKTQLEFNLNKGSRGGRRSGSGRKRIHSKGVAHRVRETISSKTPMHINFKYKAYIRNKHCLRLLKRAIMRARMQGLRVIHFSLQTNHIHLIVESINNEVLTSGMRALTVTFSKGLKKGRVQLERYHLHVLRSLNEARNAVNYVLYNHQKHTGRRSVDVYSSLINVVIGKNMEIEMDDPKSYLIKKPRSGISRILY